MQYSLNMTQNHNASPVAEESALRLSLSVLKKRRSYMYVSGGISLRTPAAIIQARATPPYDFSAEGIRVGFTCSKKVGNAVDRNFAKRRLREVARLTLPRYGQNGWDYVLIGLRAKTANRGFKDLIADIENGLATIHGT